MSLLAAFRLTTTERFQTALFLSAAFHATVLLGVSFRAPDPRHFKDDQSALDVVLVNSKSSEKPLNALALAQANLDGGGNTDENRRVRSPLPALDKEARSVERSSQREFDATLRRLATLEEQTKRMLTQLNARKKVAADSIGAQRHSEADENQPDPLPETEAAADIGQGREPQPRTQSGKPVANSDALNRARAIAQLEAQISKSWDEYQKRPKRKFIGARTQEYRFAQYIEDWRLKVEKVGNDHYPEAARQNKLYGSLLLTVAIRSDGNVEDIEIVRSSGHRILDAAALRIVDLAVPFAPFPDAVRSDTDVLHVTRTWTFTKADQIVSE